jgi:hypothetical protein
VDGGRTGAQRLDEDLQRTSRRCGRSRFIRERQVARARRVVIKSLPMLTRKCAKQKSKKEMNREEQEEGKSEKVNGKSADKSTFI